MNLIELSKQRKLEVLLTYTIRNKEKYMLKINISKFKPFIIIIKKKIIQTKIKTLTKLNFNEIK